MTRGQRQYRSIPDSTSRTVQACPPGFPALLSQATPARRQGDAPRSGVCCDRAAFLIPAKAGIQSGQGRLHGRITDDDAEKVRNLLLRSGAQRFCDDCLARSRGFSSPSACAVCLSDWGECQASGAKRPNAADARGQSPRSWRFRWECRDRACPSYPNHRPLASPLLAL